MRLKFISVKLLFLFGLLGLALMVGRPAKVGVHPAEAARLQKLPGTIAFPGTDLGAEKLLRQFLDPKVDGAALTQQLRPGAKDYKAVFLDEAAKKAYQRYQKPWNDRKIVIKHRPDQTQLLLFRASSDELKNSKGAAQVFPAGYLKIASLLQPDLNIYRFKFVKPGEDLGYAWDGLIYVNGHWTFFPKPWRVLP